MIRRRGSRIGGMGPLGPALLAVLVVVVSIMAGGAGHAQAPGFSGRGGEGPLEVEADDGIEWNREAQTMTARGKARARQGDVAVDAEILTAHYREKAGGGNEVYRIDALGGVAITSEETRITGETGVYSLDQGLLMLKGDNLKLQSQDQTITAKESVEFYIEKDYAVARGDAVAVRDEQRLRADVMVAWLGPSGKGEEEKRIRQIEAYGDVLISTPTEIVRGDKGLYNLDTQMAELCGSVKITRGKNQLVGECAQVNMKTGISRLQGGRVRGLFVPGEVGDTEPKR